MKRVRVFAGALLAVVVVLAAAPHPSAARSGAKAPTRYSLVNGCYALRSGGGAVGGADGPYRMQAAALGQYLLYGVHDDFLGGDLAPASVPGSSTVWQVDGTSRHGFTLTNLGTGRAQPVSFAPASGCAVYPEGGVDAGGRTFTGASPVGTVNGTVDAHTHVTAFEFLGGAFHCGRPWSPYGIAYALPDCASDQQGSNGAVQSFLDYGTPSHPHDPVGWPSFRDWPSPTDLAEEGDYYTGIERAWKAGLRIMVTHLVDNEALCDLMTKRVNPCNDMASVFIQARDLQALQNYIDAQSGGPGKGFFRIVTNPFQARQVINQGKLAVQEGIEVSDLFNCGEFLGNPKCSAVQVNQGLDAVEKVGVSTFFPVHKFDNAFGGTKMDGGDLGLIINGGNHLETGSFWDVQPCAGAEHDSQQITAPTGGPLLSLLNGPVAKLLGGALLPTYAPGPSCNQRGLTPLGAYLIDQLIGRHLVLQLDHMDAVTADQTLAILERRHYSGVVSAHSWDSPQQNGPIYQLGGFITPIAGSSPGAFVSSWRAARAIRSPRYYFGFGYGADMNGLAEQSQPTSGNPITYPFKSWDGRVTFSREQWGQRSFDLNRDGVANYGMYADWLQELRVLAGKPILTDMFHGAEAYLEMWERAYGVPTTRALPAHGRFAARGIARLRLGAGYQQVLYAAGQPLNRPGSDYLYRVGPRGLASVVFDRRGRVAV
ncbi:MAG: hypothetical protein M3Z06_04120, partial [Actinomycetota bacterium]|nr:hypothetical protein [Actinomycetota bacterium]